MREISDVLLQQARDGGVQSVRAASKLMTLLENEPGLHIEFLRKTGFQGGPRLVLGITGAPGSGKSTLTDALLAGYRKRFPEMKIGVIAVDPSSPFSGGAILADRVRMMRHAPDPGIFIRSMASRGYLGGLSLGVTGVLGVMAWMGMDLVLIETVGVGQSEVDIVRTADEVAVVLAPGNGDSMQLLKAGLMEIGDLIVINKADRGGAEALHAEVLATLQLETRPTGRDVALVSATEHTGMEYLIDLIEKRALEKFTEQKQNRLKKNRETIRGLLLQLARQRLLEIMESDVGVKKILGELDAGQSADWNALIELMFRSAADQKSGGTS